MKTSLRHDAILGSCLVLLLAGCGGGGGGGSDAGPTVTGPTTTTTVTLYHQSGRMAATGTVLAGTTIKTGVWSEYFDVEGSPRQWQRSYTQDTWDTAKDWREWNADGSVRNDASDH